MFIEHNETMYGILENQNILTCYDCVYRIFQFVVKLIIRKTKLTPIYGKINENNFIAITFHREVKIN